MMLGAFRKLKDAIWPSGGSNKIEPGSPYLSDSEIASLKRQLKASSEDALDTAKRYGVKIHPRVAAIKAAQR